MKPQFDRKQFHGYAGRQKDMSGFSMIELIIVLVIISVLSAISLPYIYQYRKLYRTEDQALKVMDLMREAGQLAITRRRTFRLEIDTTDNQLLIIDETGPSPAATDNQQQIKAIPLDPVNEVRMNSLTAATIPAGVVRPSPPTYTDAAFAVDTIGHKRAGVTVVGNTVWAVHFNSDGTAVNNTGVPISANLYFYPPVSAGSITPRNRTEVRAITIFGGSGAVRFWKHNGTTFVAQN